MITLVHTGIQVPTDRIHVASLDQVDLGIGIAWSAHVRDGAARLGTFTNDGHGSATLFRPVDRAAQQSLDAFVSQCRDRGGQPLPEEFVADNLTDEYEYARDIAAAERDGHYVTRCFDAYGIPEVATFALLSTAPPDYITALEAAGRRDLPTGTARAELWMGPQRAWVVFYRVPDA